MSREQRQARVKAYIKDRESGADSDILARHFDKDAVIIDQHLKKFENISEYYNQVTKLPYNPSVSDEHFESINVYAFNLNVVPYLVVLKIRFHFDEGSDLIKTLEISKV